MYVSLIFHCALLGCTSTIACGGRDVAVGSLPGSSARNTGGKVEDERCITPSGAMGVVPYQPPLSSHLYYMSANGELETSNEVRSSKL